MSARTIERLRRMRGLVARPGGWTQGANARNDRGEMVNYRNPQAVCWCLSGAAAAVSVDEGHTGLGTLIEIRTTLGPCGSVWIWNDTAERTQAEVVAAIDATIERLEGELSA